ncbi:hypothetical protein DM826_04975 [Halonotius aquaticus]|uniref:DUF4013 domain-containing protein n=1 Tax=Halonotius aquaticus TaxID=2216978 RepID=A0A3A6PPK2_9EURY|nr:DUF4013 domain-containing protein [Halonotius aquaticus]RJX43606.1 hypothetical protein DM826_04975 [Halonotius aquaticus]
MLNEALRVPYRAVDATGTLLVGAVLTGLTVVAAAGWFALLAVDPLIGAAVTPLIFLLSLVVRGYLVRVVAAGISERSDAPSFVRWGSLLRTGTQSTFVSVIYALPAAVCVGLAGGAAAATIIDPPGFEGIPQVLAAVAMLIGGFGLLIYGLVYLYLRPAARAVLAATGSLWAAVNPRRVVGVSLSGSYLAGWLIAMGLLTVGPLLVTPLVVISVLAGLYDIALAAIGGLLTLLVTVVLLFSLRMSAAWATGRGAADALRPDTGIGFVADALPDSPTVVDTGLPDRPTEAPPSVQVGREVDAGTGGVAQHTDGGADQSIEFGMPESTTPTTAVGDDEPGDFDWDVAERE